MKYSSITTYTPFGTVPYWITTSILVCSIVLIVTTRKKIEQHKFEFQLRLLVAIILVMTIILEQVWYIFNNYSLSNSLPLSICTLSAILSILMLLKKSNFAFDILFFSGTGGALLAILLAKLKYDFPHLLFFTYYAKHIIIVIAPIYMIAVHKFLPTWKSYKRAICVLLCPLPAIILINQITSGNYWYVMKPLKKYTYFDILPPYPYRIIVIILVYSFYFFLFSYITQIICQRIKIKAETQTNRTYRHYEK